MKDDVGYRILKTILIWGLIILVCWFLFGYLNIGAGMQGDFSN